MSRPALLCIALAIGGASSCRPCEPSDNPTTFVTSSFLEHESAVITLRKGRGECKVGQVPPPKVEITSPSAERYNAKRVSVTGSDLDPQDEVRIEIDFREAGAYSLRLEYTETHVTTLGALVAIDRQRLVSEALEGVSCDNLWQNEKGTMGCIERYSPANPGVDGFFRSTGVVFRNGQRLLTFGDHSRLFPGPSATFWVSTADGGLSRYQDDGATLPVESPGAGTEVASTVLALVPQESGAWVLTKDALYWVASEDAGLTIQSTHAMRLGTVLPALVARGRVVFVASKPIPDATELCGYQLASDGGIENLPESCFQTTDRLIAADGERLWLQGAELTLLRQIPCSFEPAEREAAADESGDEGALGLC